jgi:hypothetical protein
MPIDFSNTTPYVYEPKDNIGKGVTIDFNDLPQNVIEQAVRRAFNHVFGNEAIAKKNAREKADGTLAPEAAIELMNVTRDKYLTDILSGAWADGSGRAPRGPSANRLEQIFNNLLAEDVRKTIAKANYEATGKDTWLVHINGRPVPVTLADFMAKYLDNPKLGEARRASLTERANIKYNAERADADARKAAKAREAGVKAEGLDDF